MVEEYIFFTVQPTTTTFAKQHEAAVFVLFFGHTTQHKAQQRIALSFALEHNKLQKKTHEHNITHNAANAIDAIFIVLVIVLCD